MQKQTEIYMKQNHMTRPGDGVLVGLSGGADSVGLLLVLWKLRETLQISLRALHVHHGLRGAEADRDAAFSRMLCERLEVPFYEFRIDAAKEALDRKCSVEEAGRLARYRLYEETARAWEEEIRRVHIATAHHADDNAETVLFNLFRGSGLTGLSGIAPVRGRIIRPLLWAQRSEIQTWLRQQGQDWVEDSTNQESEYSRNWLRNELLPAVEERLNAQAVRHIDQAGRRIRQADAYLEEVAEEWLQKHAPDGKADAGALAEQAEIVQGYIVRRLFLKSKMPLRDVTETHVQAVRELLHQGTGKSISLPHGFRAVNIYGFLEVRRRNHDRQRRDDDLISPENAFHLHSHICILLYSTRFNTFILCAGSPNNACIASEISFCTDAFPPPCALITIPEISGASSFSTTGSPLPELPTSTVLSRSDSSACCRVPPEESVSEVDARLLSLSTRSTFSEEENRVSITSTSPTPSTFFKTSRIRCSRRSS